MPKKKQQKKTNKTPIIIAVAVVGIAVLLYLRNRNAGGGQTPIESFTGGYAPPGQSSSGFYSPPAAAGPTPKPKPKKCLPGFERNAKGKCVPKGGHPVGPGPTIHCLPGFHKIANEHGGWHCVSNLRPPHVPTLQPPGSDKCPPGYRFNGINCTLISQPRHRAR